MSLSLKVRLKATLKYAIHAFVLYGISLLTIEKLILRYIFKDYIHKRRQLSNRLFSVFNGFVQLYCFYKFKRSKRGYTQRTANLALKEPSKYGHWKDIKEIKYTSTFIGGCIIDCIHLILNKDPNLCLWMVHHFAGIACVINSIATDQFFGINVIGSISELISIPLFFAWFSETYFADYKKTHAFFKCILAVAYLKLRTKDFCTALVHAIYYGLQNQSSLGIEKRDQRSQIGRYCLVGCLTFLFVMQILWTWKVLVLAKKAIQQAQVSLKYTLQACVLYGISLVAIKKIILRYMFKNFHSHYQLADRLFSFFNAFVQLYCFYKIKTSERGYSQTTVNLALKDPSKYGHWKDVSEIKYASALNGYLIIDLIHLTLNKDRNLNAWIIHHLFGMLNIMNGILTDQFFGAYVVCVRSEITSFPLFFAWFYETYFSSHRKTHAFFKLLFLALYLKLRTKDLCTGVAYSIYYAFQNQDSLGIEKRDQRSEIGRYLGGSWAVLLFSLHIWWTWKAMESAKRAVQKCL